MAFSSNDRWLWMTNESLRHLFKNFGHIAHPIFIFPTIYYASWETVSEKMYTQHTQRNPMHSFFIFPRSLKAVSISNTIQCSNDLFSESSYVKTPQRTHVSHWSKIYDVFYFPQIKSIFVRHAQEIVIVNKSYTCSTTRVTQSLVLLFFPGDFAASCTMAFTENPCKVIRQQAIKTRSPRLRAVRFFEFKFINNYFKSKWQGDAV